MSSLESVAMEGFRPRRSIRVANMRMGFEARDSNGSSRDRPSSSSTDATDAMAKMKAELQSLKLSEAIDRPLSALKSKTKDKDGESITQKSIAMNESLPETTTKKKDGRVRVPRPKKSPYDFTLPQWKIRSRCAQSLALFNKNTDGPKYVLVKALRCYTGVFPLLHHCNFIARPQYAPDAAEDGLFFGELKYVGHVSEVRVLVCTVSCMLGGADIETGLQGCEFCTCEHPVDIEFFRSPTEAVNLDELTGYN